MICTPILLAGLAFNTCDVKALEPSPLKPQERCIVLMDNGKRYSLPMRCERAFNKIYGDK